MQKGEERQGDEESTLGFGLFVLFCFALSCFVLFYFILFKLFLLSYLGGGESWFCVLLF